MRAETYMQRIRQAEEELRTLGAKRRHYLELATSIGAGISSVPIKSSDNTSRVESAAVSMVDLAGRLDGKIEAYTAMIAEAEGLIDKIPQERYRRFLTLHYLCGLSIRSVSDEMDYKDPKSIYRIKSWALREFQRILNNTTVNSDIMLSGKKG